jgi:hypothetical protein
MRPTDFLSSLGPRFDVLPERLQLLVPMGLELVEPPLQCDHGLGAEPKDPYPCVFLRPFIPDDPGLQKDPQVPAHGWGGCRRRSGELACSARAGTEDLHDVTAGGIGQRLEQQGHFRVFTVEIYRHC